MFLSPAPNQNLMHVCVREFGEPLGGRRIESRENGKAALRSVDCVSFQKVQCRTRSQESWIRRSRDNGVPRACRILRCRFLKTRFSQGFRGAFGSGVLSAAKPKVFPRLFAFLANGFDLIVHAASSSAALPRCRPMSCPTRVELLHSKERRLYCSEQRSESN